MRCEVDCKDNNSESFSEKNYKKKPPNENKSEGKGKDNLAIYINNSNYQISQHTQSHEKLLQSFVKNRYLSRNSLSSKFEGQGGH